MKKHIILALVLLCGLLFSSYGFTSDSVPTDRVLICSVLETVTCVAGDECEKGNAEDVNLPQFLSVDLKRKVITGTKVDGTQLKTEIGRIENARDKLVLQGSQLGKAWTIVFNKKTKKFVLTVTDGEVGYTVFGAWIYR